jgi:HSP20 family protein
MALPTKRKIGMSRWLGPRDGIASIPHGEIARCFDEDTLIISGEKKAEKKEEDEKSYRRETTCGAFGRVIPSNSKIDVEKVSASFKHGVLRVTLTKVPGRAARAGQEDRDQPLVAGRERPPLE